MVRPKNLRQLVLGLTFAALVVTSGYGFALTELGHAADLRRGEVSADVVAYETESTGDGLAVLVTFRISNPTPAPVVVTAPGSINGYAPGEQRRVARVAGRYDPQTIPSSSAVRRTERFVVIEDSDRERVESAVAAGEFRVSGVFNAKIRDREFQFETGRGVPADG